MPKPNLRKVFREWDDIAKIVTGKRIMELGSLVVSMLKPDLSPDPNDPYNVLGIQRTASDKVVKFAYRALAFEYHPDTGTHPDAAKFQKATEAYDQIKKERQMP